MSGRSEESWGLGGQEPQPVRAAFRQMPLEQVQVASELILTGLDDMLLQAAARNHCHHGL